MIRKVFATISAILLLMSCTEEKDVYMFSYFGDQSYGLKLAYSYDGYHFTELYKSDSTPFLVPEIGPDKLLRDPSIVKGDDGLFHMVWTTGWNDSIIGHAASPDLVNWGEQQTIPVMASCQSTQCCWAPELFYDTPTGLYYIFWSTRMRGEETFRVYGVTTKDFSIFSDTFLFYAPDTLVIDAAIVRSPVDSSLIMAVHASPTPEDKGIHISKRVDDNGVACRTLSKGWWSPMSDKICNDTWSEGPAPFFKGDTLMVYYDQFRNGTYGLSISPDNGQTWEIVPYERYSFPEGEVRHGTIFKISERDFNKLIEIL